MRLALCCLRFGVALFSLTWGTHQAHARRAGLTESACTGCHGTRAAELEVSFDPPVTEPSQTTTVTLRVKADTLEVAGMAVSLPEGGEFSIPADEPLSVSGVWVIHTQPKPALDGEVVFRFDWTSPSEVGSGAYTAAALAANDNRVQTGDSTASTSGRIAYGCEALTLYRDFDGDGVGVTSQFLTDCVGLDGFVATAGDCDDDDVTKYPGAPESCNEVDDDCDDMVDEEVVDQTYYLDEDADGYGYPESSMVSCSPLAGYVLNALDCNWKSGTIHPEAVEVCDLVDNDCDDQIDEDFEVYCGSGECRRRGANCLVTCVPGEPSAELCNGLDDDCDEQVDEEVCEYGTDDGAATAPSVVPVQPPVVLDPDDSATAAADAGRADELKMASSGASEDAQPPKGAGTHEAGAAEPPSEPPLPASSSATLENEPRHSRPADSGCALTSTHAMPRPSVLALLGAAALWFTYRRRS